MFNTLGDIIYRDMILKTFMLYNKHVNQFVEGRILTSSESISPTSPHFLCIPLSTLFNKFVFVLFYVNKLVYIFHRVNMFLRLQPPAHLQSSQ